MASLDPSPSGGSKDTVPVTLGEPSEGDTSQVETWHGPAMYADLGHIIRTYFVSFVLLLPFF